MLHLKFSKPLILSFIVALLFLAPTLQTYANTHLVTPLVINLDLEKRDIIKDFITLTNKSDRLVRIYASVNTVAMDGNGVIESFVQKSIADKTNTPTTWIEISRKRIELQPNEVREIPFTVRMNPLTKPGNYNVFIGFAEGTNRPTAQSKVAQGIAPGTIVSISVDQEQNQFLRLEKFVVDKFITNKEGETLTYTLFNPGSVAVIPEGEVIFYDNSGNEISALNLNTDKTEVPANKSTQYNMEVPKDFSIGKYKAFLSVEYGSNLTASVQDTSFFYVLPLKLLALIFFAVLLFALTITLLVHRRFATVSDTDGSENVAMYIREGTSDEQHHDIDLSQKNKD